MLLGPLIALFVKVEAVIMLNFSGILSTLTAVEVPEKFYKFKSELLP